MYYKTIEDEDGSKTIYHYEDEDQNICVKLEDFDGSGKKTTEILYLRESGDLKAWIEMKGGVMSRVYVVDQTSDSEEVIIFDGAGRFLERA